MLWSEGSQVVFPRARTVGINYTLTKDSVKTKVAQPCRDMCVMLKQISYSVFQITFFYKSPRLSI